MQAELSPQPGQLVGGKYRLLRVLGQGAMGIVFEAQHVATEKRVAIKWLHTHLMESRSAVERLVREAQASARVRHPNVVDIYDVEREGEALFLVMEYLEGEPLSAVLERGGMPISDLLAVIVQSMRGVAEAHRQGVVHRDIKPDNIFLAHEPDRPLPVAKVLDFGVSKLETPGGVSLTQTGSALGTPLYMSYEQLAGMRDVDARSDVYAFGVILYEALTGTLPYLADNFAELAAKVITTDPVTPRQLRPELPDELDQIVMHAIRKRREERTPTIGALIDQLTPFTTPRGHRAMTPTSLSPFAAPKSAPRAAPSLAVSAPASAPMLRLDEYSDWNDALDRSQRSRREMEDRVTALIAGTMPEYSRKKRGSGRGMWMAVGALSTLIAGLGLATRFRDDLSRATAAMMAPASASQGEPVRPSARVEAVRPTSTPLPDEGAGAVQPTAEPPASAPTQVAAVEPTVEPAEVAQVDAEKADAAPPSDVAPVEEAAAQPSTTAATTVAEAKPDAATTQVAPATQPAPTARVSGRARSGSKLPRFERPSGELVTPPPVVPAEAPAIEPAATAIPTPPPPADDTVPPSPYESDDPTPPDSELRHRAGSPSADEF